MAPPPAAETGPLTLVLTCPKCGAPFETDDETPSLRCAHCGSLLLLAAPDREEIYVADGFVRDAAGVLDVVLAYRLQSARGEILAGLGDADPDALELWVEARLRVVEAELRRTLRVAEAHRVHVPYWHITGRIVQGILGRAGDGPKRVRLRAFAVEHTVPAYDVARANLRDRGLRLCRARVRPLTSAMAADLHAFLPWRPVADRPYREIDRWKGQDLDATLEAVTRHARFLRASRALVYRPYWLARVGDGGGEAWTLIDAQFRTIAGHPTAGEARLLREQAAADPLASASAAYRHVEIAASRCPDCGFEGEFARGEHIVVCTNCHLALAPGARGARVVPYDHVRVGEVRLDGDCLPFWRYELALDLGGTVVRRLEDYARAAFPSSGGASVLAARGPHLWVPAFRLLGTETGDETLRALVEWVHAHPPECVEGKVPLGGDLRAWGVTVPEAEARELLTFVLLGLHGKRAAARLTTRSWKAAAEAPLTTGPPRLVMLPFEREGAMLRAAGDGPRVPLLLLEGGPELEAQRASVHRARATAPPPFPRLSY